MKVALCFKLFTLLALLTLRLLPLLTLFTLFKQLQSKKAVMPRYTEYGYIALWVGAGLNTLRVFRHGICQKFYTPRFSG